MLRNNLGLTTTGELESAEREITHAALIFLKESPVQPTYDLRHLCAIHCRVFGDIYDWAGQLRTVAIAKGAASATWWARSKPAVRSEVCGDHYQADQDKRRNQADPTDGGDPEQDVVLAELAALLFWRQPWRAVARRSVVQPRPANSSSWATEVNHDASYFRQLDGVECAGVGVPLGSPEPPSFCHLGYPGSDVAARARPDHSGGGGAKLGLLGQRTPAVPGQPVVAAQPVRACWQPCQQCTGNQDMLQ